MTTKLLLEYADILTALLSAAVLIALYRRRALRDFAFLAAFLATEIVNQSIQGPIRSFCTATRSSSASSLCF